MIPTCAAASSHAPASQPARFTSGFSTRAQIVAGACACAGFSTFVFAVDPSRHAVYPQCVFHNVTGLYCAGCGATRALYALLHGRLLDALHDNALFVAALPILLYLVVSYALAAWRRDAWPPIQADGRGMMWRAGAIFLLLVAFMIARNLPGAPFDWLRPL